jgi:hypothetical protein
MKQDNSKESSKRGHIGCEFAILTIMFTQCEMKRQYTTCAESILHVSTQFGIKIVYC